MTFCLIVFLSMSVSAPAQEFPLGWYAPTDYTTPRPTFRGHATDTGVRFRSVGMNTVLAYKENIYNVYEPDTWPMDLTKLIRHTEKYLALYPDFKVILDITAAKKARTDRRNNVFRKEADVTTYITRFRNHHQVAGWYIADEPEQSWTGDEDNATYFSVQALERRYRLVKSLSRKPVFVATASPDDFGRIYGGKVCYDVLMVDCYPITHAGRAPTEARWVAERTRALVRNDANTASSTFYFIAQGQGDSSGYFKGPREYWGHADPSMHEVRYMSLAPLIEGAGGMLFWSYQHASRRGKSSDSWRTVHGFVEWFTSPVFHRNLGSIPDDPAGSDAPRQSPTNGWVSYRVKQVRMTQPDVQEYFIIGVNNNPRREEAARIPLPPVPGGAWEAVVEECAPDENAVSRVALADVAVQAGGSINVVWNPCEAKVFRVVFRKTG